MAKLLLEMERLQRRMEEFNEMLEKLGEIKRRRHGGRRYEIRDREVERENKEYERRMRKEERMKRQISENKACWKQIVEEKMRAKKKSEMKETNLNACFDAIPNSLPSCGDYLLKEIECVPPKEACKTINEIEDVIPKEACKTFNVTEEVNPKEECKASKGVELQEEDKEMMTTREWLPPKAENKSSNSLRKSWQSFTLIPSSRLAYGYKCWDSSTLVHLSNISPLGHKEKNSEGQTTKSKEQQKKSGAKVEKKFASLFIKEIKVLFLYFPRGGDYILKEVEEAIPREVPHGFKRVVFEPGGRRRFPKAINSRLNSLQEGGNDANQE